MEYGSRKHLIQNDVLSKYIEENNREIWVMYEHT